MKASDRMDRREKRLYRFFCFITFCITAVAVCVCVASAFISAWIDHWIVVLAILIGFVSALSALCVGIVIIGYLMFGSLALRTPLWGRVARVIVRHMESNGMYKSPHQELVTEMLETQALLTALQNQINPHFLYNTLESIRSKALLHNEEEIATMTETLALLFRYNIGRDKETASLSDELENVKNYVKIQNYRFRDKFVLKIDMSEIEDVLDSYQIPPLTLQPLIENAIHHGLEHKMEQGLIRIYCTLSQRELLIFVQDNGIGIPAETVDRIRRRLHEDEGVPKQTAEGSNGSGIALINVHRRLQILFGPQYGLELMSTPNIGTQICLSLPTPANQERKAHEI